MILIETETTNNNNNRNIIESIILCFWKRNFQLHILSAITIQIPDLNQQINIHENFQTRILNQYVLTILQ